MRIAVYLAVFLTSTGCLGIRISSLGHSRLPLCTLEPRASEQALETPCSLLLFADKGHKLVNDKTLSIANRSAIIRDASALLKTANEDKSHKNTKAQNGSLNVYLVRNDIKMGFAQLKDESIYDMRANHYRILDLAKMALKTDAIIVTLEYGELMKKGVDLYQLKLLDVVLFTLRQFCTTKLNIHFLIYKYEKPAMEEHQKDFQKRHKKEIEEIFLGMFKGDNDMNSITCSFTDSKEPTDSLDLIANHIDRIIAIRRACGAQLQKETKNNLETIQRISAVQDFIKTSVNDVNSNLKGLDLSLDAGVINHLLEKANSMEQKFNNWMQENAVALGEIPTKLKEQVDQLTNELLKQFDAVLQTAGAQGQRNARVVRAKLVESLQTKLGFLMDGISLKLQDATLQEFQNQIQTLAVDENLDLNLQDAIAKFDNMYRRSIEACTFDILKSSGLHKLKAEMQRKDVIDNMKEVSNHVLEYAIGKGLFYSRISISDGISYMPSSFITRFLKKWISKLKVPMHISLNYLSPTAFGFSNLFRDRIPSTPGIVRYFTGGKPQKMFSSDEATRRRANSLVRKDN